MKTMKGTLTWPVVDDLRDRTISDNAINIKKKEKKTKGIKIKGGETHRDKKKERQINRYQINT